MRKGRKKRTTDGKSILETVKELRIKLHDIDQKLEHVIRSIRRFNHGHYNSVDESI